MSGAPMTATGVITVLLLVGVALRVDEPPEPSGPERRGGVRRTIGENGDVRNAAH